MAVEFTGGEELARLASVLHAAAASLDHDIEAALKPVADPVGAAVIRRGAAGLPKHGGLARAVPPGGVHVSVTAAGLLLEPFSRRANLARLDDGTIRHPVFGNRRGRWVTQRIRPHLFTDAFEKDAKAKVAPAAEKALAKIADRISREA